MELTWAGVNLLWYPLLGGDTNQIPSTISTLLANRGTRVNGGPLNMPKKNFADHQYGCNNNRLMR